jgi:hypothetical protein
MREFKALPRNDGSIQAAGTVMPAFSGATMDESCMIHRNYYKKRWFLKL